MRKIGGWWLAGVDALDNEWVRLSFLANRTQSRRRAVGGKLFITNRRFVFTPHWIDFVTGGKRLEVALSTVTDVGIQPRGGDTFGGGLRDRLRIRHEKGTELFVVNRLSDVAADIRSALG